MIAAEKIEFDGIRQHVSERRTLDWPVTFAEEGEMHSRTVTLLANGAGPTLAAQAFQTACEHAKVDAVVSTGFCGGLDPVLVIGDLIAATEVLAHTSGKRFASCQPAADRGLTRGPILSVDRVAVTVQEKRQLRTTGAAAVEMEAAGIAECASARNIPFYCIRAVSDAAGDAMPLDFNLYRTTQGRFDRGAIARAAISRPWPRIPALLRLQRHARLASNKLGEFFADNRF